MNLKIILFTIFLSIFTFDAFAANSISKIRHKQYISCGIDTNYPELAYKEDGSLKGFDVDICKSFAAAILGDSEKTKFYYVPTSEIGKALNTGKIDIMLGHTSLTSSQEIKYRVLPVDTLYFDRQVFASRHAKEASSMRDFSGEKVCVLRNSAASAFLSEYNQRYALGFNILEMPDLSSAKEAFYLNRCSLISDGEIFIKSIVSNLKSKDPAEILPEEIAYLPIKAYSSGNNPELNITFRWILNALKLAQSAGITSQNIDTFNATKSASLQNLLGISPNAWHSLDLISDWVKDYISTYGNYQQIIEHNIGPSSKLNLDIRANDLVENGGLLTYQPFL